MNRVFKKMGLNPAITCLNCKHCHMASDVEFDIYLPPKNPEYCYPTGRYQANIDLCWCEIPETTEDDFTILSWGKPSQFYKEVWFLQLAKICKNYERVKPNEQT